MSNMSFSLETFVSSPMLEEINTSAKKDLLTISQHYKLSVTSAMSKAH